MTVNRAAHRRRPAWLTRASAVPWRRWGPNLSERQWGWCEDYSADGDAWTALTARAGAAARLPLGRGRHRRPERRPSARLCFAIALWNGADAILKRAPLRLTNTEGNHGEDVKEVAFHLDNVPTTHSWMKRAVQVPQRAFHYGELIVETGGAGMEPEYELLDTGIFDDRPLLRRLRRGTRRTRPTDLLIRIVAVNRGPDRPSCTCCRRCGSQRLVVGRMRPTAAHRSRRRRTAPRRPRRNARHAHGCSRRTAALPCTENESNAPRLGRAAAALPRMVRRVVIPRTPRRGESAARGQQGEPGRVRRGRPGGGRWASRRGSPTRLRSPTRWGRPSTPMFEQRRAEADVLSAGDAVRDGRRPAPRAAPGVRRAAVGQAVVPLRRAALAAGRSGVAPPPAQRRIPATTRGRTRCRRRDLYARQVGVPVVRRVGPGLPLHPFAGSTPTSPSSS